MTASLYDANRVLHRERERDDGKIEQLIGEDDTVLTAFISFVFSDQPVLISGFSGSGKTVVANSIWSLIPEDWRYEYQMGTDKNIWYSENFQTADYVYFSELQKAAQSLDVLEAMKSWGEGKPYTRSITTTVDGERTTEEVVLPPRPFFTTFAEENTDAEIDEELGRRVIKLYADPSQDQTIRIVETKAEKFSNPWDAGDDIDVALDEVGSVVRSAVMSDPQKVALPGFDAAFADHLPTDFHDTRSVIDHFFSVISGVARYYGGGGGRVEHDGVLLATPRDLFEAFEIYKTTLLNNCLRLENLGESVLKAFPAIEPDGTVYDEQKLTASEVMAELKHTGVMVPKNKVQAVIANLMMAGYIEEDATTRPTSYHRSGIAETPDSLVISWNDIVKIVLEESESILPSGVAEEYAETVTSNIVFEHPVTGDEVNLRNYTGSSDPTEGKEKKVETSVDRAKKEHKTFDEIGMSWE